MLAAAGCSSLGSRPSHRHSLPPARFENKHVQLPGCSVFGSLASDAHRPEPRRCSVLSRLGRGLMHIHPHVERGRACALSPGRSWDALCRAQGWRLGPLGCGRTCPRRGYPEFPRSQGFRTLQKPCTAKIVGTRHPSPSSWIHLPPQLSLFSARSGIFPGCTENFLKRNLHFCFSHPVSVPNFCSFTGIVTDR